MNSSKTFLQNLMLKEMDLGGWIPSKSRPGEKHFVWFRDGGWECDCIAGMMNRMCSHKKRMALEIVRTHEEKKCFYCGTTFWIARGLEQHHTYRRSTHPELKNDPKKQVWLCRRCHHRATVDRKFEENLQNICNLRG